MRNPVTVNVSGAAKLFDDMSFEQKVDMAREFGGEGIEIHTMREWPPEQGGMFAQDGGTLKRVREIADTMDALSVHSVMGETITSKDDETREKAIGNDRAVIREAAFLGASVVVIHVRMAYLDRDDAVTRAAAVLRDHGDYAEASGIRLAVETATDLRRLEDFLRLIDTIDHPHVGATLDTGHLLNCFDRDTPRAEFAQAYNDGMLSLAGQICDRAKLYHVHMNDIRAETLYDHYGMGLGFVDFPGFVSLVRQGGYEGAFAIEMHRGDADEVGSITAEEFQAAVEYVKTLAKG